MMRSRVGFGMCRADGASLRTADTVPADKPTCAATAFRVTRPFCAAAFLTLVIVLAIRNAVLPGRTVFCELIIVHGGFIYKASGPFSAIAGAENRRSDSRYGQTRTHASVPSSLQHRPYRF